VAGSGEQDSKPPVSIKGGVLHDQLSDYHISRRTLLHAVISICVEDLRKTVKKLSG
jgi:hypothetical protein